MWTHVEQALNQSAANVLAGLAGLLPGLVAMLVAMAVAALLGWALALAARRALVGVEFDRRLSAWSGPDVTGWVGERGPTAVAVRVVFWAVVALGFVVGLAAFDPTLTSQLAFRLFGSALDLLTAVVILVIGGILARVVSRSVLISLVNMNVRQARLLSLGVKWLVNILAFAMALDHLRIGGRIVELAFAILFGGIVLALALVVGLRSRELVDWSAAQQSDRPRDDEPPLRHL